MALDDLIQAGPGALRYIDQSFAAGDLQLRRFRAPAGQKFAEVFFDLSKRKSFELTVIELADALFDDHWEMMRLADHFRGAPRALQVASVDRTDVLGAQPRRDIFGLAHADLAQITV